MCVLRIVNVKCEMQEWDGIIADGIKHRINSNQTESCKMRGIVDSRGKDGLDLLLSY